MGKTKKPTGLSITRDGYKFIFNWKIGTVNYGAGQDLQWRRQKYNGNWDDWNNKSVTATATTADITLTASNYYPNTDKFVKNIEFRVRGQRSPYTEDGKRHTPTVSDWSSKEFPLATPNVPSVSATLTASNATTFAWSVNTSANDAKLYAKYEWQTIRVQNSNETDGGKLTWNSSATGWQTGNGTATSGTKAITDDVDLSGGNSFTRWFRVRSIGTAGASAWAYSKHIYAIPYIAQLNTSKCSATIKPYGYMCTLTWTASRPVGHPIDETVVRYAKAVPIANLQPPASPSWQEVSSSRDTKGTDTATFNIDGLMSADECLFVQVLTKHDSQISYSTPYLLKLGTLSAPSTPTISISGNTATVSVTNNSEACIYTGTDTSYKRLFLVIFYKGAKQYTGGYVAGIMPTSQSSIQITLPDQTSETAYSIGARAIVGTYSGNTVTSALMYSDTVWTTASVSKPPINAKVEFTGTIDVSWAMGWADAESTEVSWSYNKNAWNSTTQPTTYTVENRGTSCVIDDIQLGKTIYVRLRHFGNDIFSSYTDIISADLFLNPPKQRLSLSASTITEKGKVTASWNYTSGDGTEQTYAEVRLLSGSTIGNIVGKTTNASYITLYAQDLGWTGGNTYRLVLKVCSASGGESEYSDPVAVYVKPPIVASLTSSSLVDETVDGRTYKALKALPLIASVTGGDTSSLRQLAIERAQSYHIDRPNDDQFNGYEGETVYYKNGINLSSFTVNMEDLLGSLDDGAKYRLVATVSDNYGQKDSATIDFEVHWTHQAIVPSGTVQYTDGHGLITPVAPTGTASGDYCDIYRLSADNAVLIAPHAEFGKVYTDPYPTIGEYGGYRIVFITSNGDYITENGTLAWFDIHDIFESEKSIIDFGTDQIELYYNVDVSHNWSKDFTMTKYLGGSIQGDWNPAVERDSSVTAVTLNPLEEDTINGLSRLAEYTGICHIRTTDGANFTANIDVNKSSSHDKYGMATEYSLNIQRIDPDGYDAINLDTE